MKIENIEHTIILFLSSLLATRTKRISESNTLFCHQFYFGFIVSGKILILAAST